MTDVRQNITTWVDETKKALIDEYVSSGRKASGQWAKELSDETTVTFDKVNIKILGAAYTGALVNGRKPNQNKENIRAFVGWAGSTFLAQWVKDKGIKASPYAIAYSIARNGIKVPNQHNDGKLIDNVITDERIAKLLQSITQVYDIQIRSEVMKIYNQ